MANHVTNHNVQSFIQTSIIIGSIAFGYGALDSKVTSNREQIQEVKRAMQSQNVDFLRKIDAYLEQQQQMNAQIVENTTTIKLLVSSK